MCLQITYWHEHDHFGGNRSQIQTYEYLYETNKYAKGTTPIHMWSKLLLLYLFHWCDIPVRGTYHIQKSFIACSWGITRNIMMYSPNTVAEIHLNKTSKHNDVQWNCCLHQNGYQNYHARLLPASAPYHQPQGLVPSQHHGVPAIPVWSSGPVSFMRGMGVKC